MLLINPARIETLALRWSNVMRHWPNVKPVSVTRWVLGTARCLLAGINAGRVVEAIDEDNQTSPARY